MSRLEELIQQYCPNGVEYKPLKDILRITSDALTDAPAVVNN